MNGALPAWLFLPVQVRLTCLNKDGYEFKINGGFMTTDEANNYIDNCEHEIILREVWAVD